MECCDEDAVEGVGGLGLGGCGGLGVGLGNVGTVGTVCGVGGSGGGSVGDSCGAMDCPSAMVAKGGTKVEALKEGLRYQCQW